MPMTRLAARKAALGNINHRELPGRISSRPDIRSKCLFCSRHWSRHLSIEIRRQMTTRGLCPCRVRSQPSVFRKRRGRSTGPPSAEGRGMAGSAQRAGRGNDCRNRCGGLEQAGGPRHYSRGLVAARYVACRPAPSVPGRPTAGQGRRLAARMLRDRLAVGRWASGGGAIASWGVGAGEIQPSSRSTSPFRTAQTTISCLLPNPSLSCMWWMVLRTVEERLPLDSAMAAYDIP